jgi:fermentation-respiration switch protein FrsA (DUF1100 family)
MERMRRSTPVLQCALICVLSLSLGCSGLVDRFLYFPKRPVSQTPESVGLAYEDLRFPSADGTELHGWWVPGRRPGPAVAFFHGNAGNIADRLALLRYLHDRLGLGVLLFDYRGYGESAGTPSEEGLYADARGVRELIGARGWDGDGLILYGRSLGAAVALQSAVESRPLGLVLEAPFTNLKETARYNDPVLSHAVGPWIGDQYDNLSKIRTVKCRILFLHGDRDAICPIAMSWRLFDAATGPKWFHTVAGAGHNDLAFAGGEAYWETWLRFLGKIEKQARESAASSGKPLAAPAHSGPLLRAGEREGNLRQ